MSQKRNANFPSTGLEQLNKALQSVVSSEVGGIGCINLSVNSVEVAKQKQNKSLWPSNLSAKVVARWKP